MKTKGKMTLDAHRLEAENKRREESEALALERIYGDERGLPWPPEEHEKEWDADRQYWINKIKERWHEIAKPTPDKPAPKKPPPIDRKAARYKARKAETDAWEEYEKRHDNPS